MGPCRLHTLNVRSTQEQSPRTSRLLKQREGNWNTSDRNSYGETSHGPIDLSGNKWLSSAECWSTKQHKMGMGRVVSSDPSVRASFELSPGEIHFLWWFIQGNIMNPSPQVRLRKNWGVCERRAWGWMAVNAAALISAVDWCCGWTAFLSVTD